MKELEAIIEKWRASQNPAFANGFTPGLCKAADELEAMLSALVQRIEAHERLAVAVALRCAAHEVRHTCGQDDSAMTSHTEDCRRCRILAFIPPADAKALDAFKAEVRNEALEEGALAVWMIHQSAAAKLRALKREKRGHTMVPEGEIPCVRCRAALDAYVQEKVDQRDDEWIAAFGAQDLTPKVTPESLAKWVFRDVEQQLAGLEREKAEAVLDFTISALDYFSKKSTTGQQGERGIYARTYQKFGEFVNSEYPKLSANRNRIDAHERLAISSALREAREGIADLAELYARAAESANAAEAGVAATYEVLVEELSKLLVLISK